MLPINNNTIPKLPEHFFLSERISKLHHKMSYGQVLEIYAPAGYGKTALVASYLSTLKGKSNQVCWIRLNKEDAEPAHFPARLFSMMFFLLKQCYPEENFHLKQKLDKGLVLEAFSGLFHLAWKSYKEEPHKLLCLALDDCEHLATARESWTILALLLNNLPPNGRLFIMSRLPLAIFKEKQKLDKRCIEITRNELALSPNEIKVLLELVNPGRPSNLLAEKLAGLCEGWVAPVLIMARALMEKERAGFLEEYELRGTAKGSQNATEKYIWLKLEVAMEQALKRLMETGSSLFNYIEDEITGDLSQEDLEELARLSLLETFSAPQAAAIYKLGNLEDLFNRNKQIALLTSEVLDNTGYLRFQSIFGCYLRKAASKIFGREQLEKFHYEAASYYIDQGFYSQAAEQIAHCPTYPKTLELVTNVGIKFMIVGESGQLKKWLELLPAQVLMINPVLLIFKALLLPHSACGEAKTLLLKAYKLGSKEGNLIIQYRAATSLVFIYYISGDMTGIVSITNRVSAVLKKLGEPFEGSSGIIALMKAIGKSAFLEGFKVAERQDIAKLPEEDRWLHLGYFSVAAIYLGIPVDAEKAMKQALSLPSVEKTEAARATGLYLLATSLFLQNKQEELLTTLEPLKGISEKYQFSFFLASVELYSGYLRYITFDRSGALTRLDEATKLYQDCGNQALALLAKLLNYLWADSPVQKELNLTRATWAVEEIGRLNAGNLLEEIALSIHGALSLDSGNYHLAEMSLLLSTKKARAKKAKQLIAGNLFYLARLYYAKGKKERGNQKLKEAMELANEGEYTLFWAMHLPTITEMTTIAIIRSYNQEHAYKILTSLFGKQNARYLEQKSKTLKLEEIRSFISRFLIDTELNPARKLYVVQVRLFGSLEISVNGNIIPDGAWKTRKNRGIMEYLLLNCGKSVQKEILIDLFWPDADSKAAHTSFRTALYMLRQLFAAYGLELVGPGSFIKETTGGLMIKNDDNIALDYIDFTKTCEKLATLKPSSETTRLEMLEKVVSLYRGELLEGKDYGDLLYFEQERCKSLFENACLELSALYIKQGKSFAAENVLKIALKTDPYSENVCRALLNLYREAGKMTKARTLLKDFKKRLKDELELEIDNSLEDMLNQ